MVTQRHLLAAIAAVLASAAVSAQASDTSAGSEFFHQANAQTSEVTGHVSYENWNFKSSTSGSTTSAIGGLKRLGVGYEYGLSEMLALGADISYTTEGMTGGGGISGLNDLMLYVKGTSAMSSMHLRYGLGLGVPLAKEKETENETTTASSGAISLTPYIGIDSQMGAGILGARVSYSYYFKHTLNLPGSSMDLEDGGFYDRNNVTGAVFYELMMGESLYGVDLHYASMMRVHPTDGVTPDFTGWNPFGLDLYARIPVNFFGSAVILPSIKWDFAGGDQFSTYSDFAVTVAARWAF